MNKINNKPTTNKQKIKKQVKEKKINQEINYK